MMNNTTHEQPAVPHIADLRQHLMATLQDLRSRTNPMDSDRARSIASVASVLVDTARVEVEYMRVTGQDRSQFLGTDLVSIPGKMSITEVKPSAHNPFPKGVTGVRQHKLQDDPE